MSEELATRESRQVAINAGVIDFPAMMQMAETLIKSGFLPAAIKTPAQAVAIMLTGRELGIPTMQALRQVNVILGKPTMAAELMLALAYQHVPGFKYSVLETTPTRCVCKFERPGHTPLTHKFDMTDAKALGLAGKDNWVKQPATMLRWRCISSGLRLVAPDAIAGVYTPEEILPDARVSAESGTIIDIEPEVASPSDIKPSQTKTPDPQPGPPTPPLVDHTPSPADKPQGSIITTEVVLGEVKTQSGTKNGKKWARHYSKGDDGEYYSTFDTKIGEAMAELAKVGDPVTINYRAKETAKGISRDVVTIIVANPPDGLPMGD